MEPITYIITFQILDAERRAIFEKKIREFSNSTCPIHKFAWALRSHKKATEIRDFLKLNLTPEDRLFVIRTGTEAAWFNPYGTANSDWLKKYL